MKWQIKNHRLEIYDPDEGKFVDYCEEIGVTSVYTDLLTGKKKVAVYLHDDTTGGVIITVPRSSVGRGIVNVLVDYGFTQIDSESVAGNIQQVLFETQATAIHKYQHDRLGFCEIDGKLAFLAHNPIGVADPVKASSEYILPAKTKPAGTLESWLDVINAEVIGHPNLELVLAIGALAPVAHLLRDSKVITLIPIVALIGRSSTGKTCSMKTIASLWGSPEESMGMLSDLNSTQNAFFAQLGNAYGLPGLYDETSAVPEWDFTKVIYNLPKGREKLRCDGEGKVRLPIHYSGAIILSGERSLFEQTNENGGLMARLLELTLPWTDDEFHADRLEYGCRTNYGTAVYPLMEWLLSNCEALVDEYHQQYSKLKLLVQGAKGIEDRLVKIYAMILTSAVAVNISLGLELNIDGICDTLLEQHRKNQRIYNTPEVLFDKFKKMVLDCYGNFSADKRTPNQLWGTIENLNGIENFWIKAEKVEEFFNDNYVEDPEKLKHTWYKNGWLKRSADRHYAVYHNIGGVRVKAYCFYLNTTNESKDTGKIKSHLKELLSKEIPA